MIDDLLDLVRREAQHVMGGQEPQASIVATSYDPKTHSIKGMIMPHEIESGWVKLAATHAGNGYGMVVGPKVGDAKKLDGDQFDLHFEGGDQSSPIAKMKHFSNQDKPPQVKSGEMLFKHQKGGEIRMSEDGSMVVSHGKKGKITFNADGELTIDGGGNGNLV